MWFIFKKNPSQPCTFISPVLNSTMTALCTYSFIVGKISCPVKNLLEPAMFYYLAVLIYVCGETHKARKVS